MTNYSDSKDSSESEISRLPSVTTDALQGAAQLFTEEVFTDEQLVHSREELLRYIEEQVVALLTKNPERLMSILYRIDVPEDKVRDVMTKGPVGSIATKLAALLLLRMEQKVQTRRRYKEQNRREDPSPGL